MYTVPTLEIAERLTRLDHFFYAQLSSVALWSYIRIERIRVEPADSTFEYGKEMKNLILYSEQVMRWHRSVFAEAMLRKGLLRAVQRAIEIGEHLLAMKNFGGLVSLVGVLWEDGQDAAGSSTTAPLTRVWEELSSSQRQLAKELKSAVHTQSRVGHKNRVAYPRSIAGFPGLPCGSSDRRCTHSEHSRTR